MIENIRILVVEDDPLIAWDIASELTDRGFVVIGPVGRVAAALDMLDQEHLSIAVLDISLGSENSFSVARALEQKGVPFMFLSGDAGQLPDEFAGRDVLTKPVDFAELTRKLEAALS